MEVKKNDDIVLDIDGLTSEGSAVGHYDGLAVFVRGAVPGDRIIAHIIKRSKSYAIAIIKDIVCKSPSRIKSDCAVSSKCGGCSFRDMTYDEELKYKSTRVLDAITRIGHIDAPVREIIGAEKIDHYRNKAQFPVAINDGELTAGFYAYKSHRIIPCNSCRLQATESEKCLAAFAKWVEAAGITAYDESTGKGLLRHIYLRKACGTGEIMACAVINGSRLPNEADLIKLLCEIPNMKSICVNINKARGNVILGNETRIIWGNEIICDTLLEKSFVISPNSFYQVNHDQCEGLYKKAAEYADLSGKEIVVDLYCGAGTIGLTMADKAKQIFGIEIIPQAIENAKINAKINSIQNAEFFCGDALEGAKLLEGRKIEPDVVILDPPRKGCQSELFDVIERMSPDRIVYVSCDCATLSRDLAILKEKGYITREVTPVDMFPRTPHIESVALIEKER